MTPRRTSTSARLSPASAPTSYRPSTLSAGMPRWRCTSRLTAASSSSKRAESRCARCARTRAAAVRRRPASSSSALRAACCPHEQRDEHAVLRVVALALPCAPHLLHPLGDGGVVQVVDRRQVVELERV